MQVREIMTESPATCTPDTTLQRVAQMMVECDCGAIPVVGDNGRPMGIVTDRDITTRIIAKGQNPLQMRAADAMTAATVTTTPAADVREASDKMEENKVRRLLVVSDGSVEGILAQADVARQAAEEQSGELVAEVSRPSGSASRPSQG